MYRKPLLFGSMVVAALTGAAAIILMVMHGRVTGFGEFTILMALVTLFFGWLTMRSAR